MAMAKLAKELGLRPHLLVHPNVVTEFAGVQLNSDDPNCVVLGDATSQFTYENMNKVQQSAPHACILYPSTYEREI